MRLLGVFLRHEWLTQLRSARFHGVTLAYIAVSTAPAIAVFVIARRATIFIGPTLYGSMVDAIQPLATTLFAAAISVDAIARERDENSLQVVSMASLSATGYVLRRWLALVMVMLPATLIARIAAIALVEQALHGSGDVTPILLGWVVRVLPLLLGVTAFAVALGTITSRTVLALIFGFGLFTMGFGIMGDLLAYAHRQIEVPAEFFGIEPRAIGDFANMIRGWFAIPVPTVAGYPLRHELDKLVISGIVAIAVIALFLGLSCSYLRRTKRDLRAWKIRDTHPLRTYLRMLNRFREEFARDGGRELPEHIALLLGVLAFVTIIVAVQRRHNTFERLAEERYNSEQFGAAPMPLTIVPVAASLRGGIANDGELAATFVITLRNDGASALGELAFQLNRGIAIEKVTSSRGSARHSRWWERVGIVLDPPLAPRETRSVTLALRGTSATYDFNLPGGQSFAARWRRYTQGTKSYDLADLSRSIVRPDATAQRIILTGPMIVPVPRYSPWTTAEVVQQWWRREQTPELSFSVDAVRPASALSIDLRVPEEFLGVDACGNASRGRVAGGCTIPLADYVLLGTRYELESLGGFRFAYMPAHRSLARRHGQGLSAAVALAKESWPGFALPRSAVFAERPAYPGEIYLGNWGNFALRAIATRGALNMLPEPMFIQLQPMDKATIAASLIAGSLQQRRRVVTEERAFFRDFYEALATWRTGGRKPGAVEPAKGQRPLTDPIIQLAAAGEQPFRLMRVLVDVEYRVGADRLVAGIDDFLAGGPTPGTAKELLDTIGRRGGVSLDRVYSDYFAGAGIPKLTFEDVVFARASDGWEVRGTLRNEGVGEVFCPVVLRTGFGSSATTVRVDTNSATPFAIATKYEPRTLQLDPDRVVYRYGAIGLVDFVDYKGAP